MNNWLDMTPEETATVCRDLEPRAPLETSPLLDEVELQRRLKENNDHTAN